MTMSRLVELAYECLDKFKFRYDLTVKHLNGKDSPERELALSYNELYQKHTSLVRAHVILMQESARLEAENNFMHKLINEKENNESN